MSTTDFTPIEATAQSSWQGPDAGTYLLNQDDEQKITDLLMGRKIEKVDNEHLLLDDGTVIKAIGHDGRCACSAGCYDLSVLNGVDNVITRVEYDYQPGNDYDSDRYDGYYRIFVFADNRQINLMQFDGTDGNGYYGTGFEIVVRPADAQESR